MNETISIVIALCLALLTAGVLILLFKKRMIDEEAISGVEKVLEGIPAAEGSTFAMIRNYAKVAVRTVEQLVKNGTISRDDAARKDAAMNMVEAAAKADGMAFGAAETEIADMCVEAEVYDLPRNQKPPDAA